MTTQGARGNGMLAGLSNLEPFIRLLYGLAVAVANFAAALVQSLAEYNAMKAPAATTAQPEPKQATKQEDTNNGKPRKNDSVTDSLL